jgi:hypothetical protein
MIPPASSKGKGANSNVHLLTTTNWWKINRMKNTWWSNYKCFKHNGDHISITDKIYGTLEPGSYSSAGREDPTASVEGRVKKPGKKTVGNHGYRSYRVGPVSKNHGLPSPTNPSKPPHSANRAVWAAYRTGFFEAANRPVSGFFNPGGGAHRGRICLLTRARVSIVQ